MRKKQCLIHEQIVLLSWMFSMDYSERFICDSDLIAFKAMTPDSSLWGKITDTNKKNKKIIVYGIWNMEYGSQIVWTTFMIF